MTTEQRKEELRKKFKKLTQVGTGLNLLPEQEQAIFDWFYSEIEAREKLIDRFNEESVKVGFEFHEYQSKIQRLEEIIKAADEVILCMPFDIGFKINNPDGMAKALEHYNKLKSKLPSGI